MPLLILAIASFLCFLLLISLLYVASSLESHTQLQKSLPAREHPLAMLSITEAFDPVIAALWEAPITALERIDCAGPTGIAVGVLRPIYTSAARCFPEIYDGYTFLQWVSSLEANGMISWRGDRVALTRDGQAFLRYRFVTNALAAA
jgi:hypothetical protein